MERLSTENESQNETRKSPRVKKRPAEDSGRKSSRKGKPKRRKECSLLYHHDDKSSNIHVRVSFVYPQVNLYV